MGRKGAEGKCVVPRMRIKVVHDTRATRDVQIADDALILTRNDQRDSITYILHVKTREEGNKNQKKNQNKIIIPSL